MDQSFEIYVSSFNNLANLSFNPYRQSIVVITETGNAESIVEKNPQIVTEIIKKHVNKEDTKSFLFVSGNDMFDSREVTTTVLNIHDQSPHCGFALFVPYKEPPRFTQREDGFVGSFMIPVTSLRVSSLPEITDFPTLAYEMLYAYLSSHGTNDLAILQIGKSVELERAADDEEVRQLLKQSLLIIPHKDEISFLERCLLSLNQFVSLPDAINLCFDDDTYKKLQTAVYSNLEKKLKIYSNEPGNVGPYLGRHFSIMNTDKDYIFFQDSDDISMPARFEKQIKEMEKRGLDMMGSHELRVDEFARVLMLIRYPIDVSESLTTDCFHALFHPTSIISKEAYLKTGGFSTDLRFGYDSQFLLRSFFHLKLGNVDDFLYIRFKRPNSLTTDPSTKLGTNLRTFLLWRWQIDFRLVRAHKLQLDDSSLSVQKHQFNYEMIEVK